MKKVLTCLAGFLFSLLLFAQNKAVTGKVSDNTGAPLPNVPVQVKGGGAGAATDSAGRFTAANFNITTVKNRVTALSNNTADIIIKTGNGFSG